jgi:hypothetical protein
VWEKIMSTRLATVLKSDKRPYHFTRWHCGREKQNTTGRRHVTQHKRRIMGFWRQWQWIDQIRGIAAMLWVDDGSGEALNTSVARHTEF